MVASAWLRSPLRALGFLLSANLTAAGMSAFRTGSAAAFSGVEACPERCFVSGPSTANWSVYASLEQIRDCRQTMFYDFSIYDPVDDPAPNHRIMACSSYGPDFSKIPALTTEVASANPVDVQFEVGWWEEGFGLAAPGLRSLVKQMRKYIDGGHGATDRPFILFGQSGQATIGLYIGQGLLNQGLSESALRLFHDRLANLGVSTPSLAMQLCGRDFDSTQTFGVMATSNGTFGPAQDAIKHWANATCLSFSNSISFAGKAVFTTPLLRGNATVAANSAFHARGLRPRAECRTVQVESGDGCATLANKCGISGADFTKFNPGNSFCSTLKPKQHVCCSSGELPDFRPKPNADGSCYSYIAQPNDNCAALAAAYSITLQDLEDFNKNTWGWSGCSPLRLGVQMCLSQGKPPFPPPISNAECGPQKPGSVPPTDGSDISQLNPCPLNACCNIWGHCGLTKDFCIDTNTGPPGTAAPGTYGCISNCGMDIVKGTGTGAIKIGYFQGYNLGRECLFQDASQIDTSRYTHIHFGFGTLTSSYEVEVGDVLSKYQFGEFKRISGARRILSFGGWDFSANPATYTIFREGVKPANRLKMATNIANFVKQHNLDGVDIDWEYPGAPDIPDVQHAGSLDEGPNYLAFLAILKNSLPGKSVSIAAPASYWYLKQYPIKEIARVVDYIVFMTYDLHGQWDATGSEYNQEGCRAGNCLRSQVNLTETRQALAMITKAGVPGSKVIVGVTSYGRSFKMAEAGCWGPNCLFTGDSKNSYAKKGRCTGTAGYIADAEIAEILNDPSRVVAKFVDTSSNSDILVYDNTEWVAYMGSSVKKARTSLYAAWGLGGTTDWASDLQAFHDVPAPAKDWVTFKLLASAGINPKVEVDDSRTGGWTDPEFTCTHDLIRYKDYFTPSERWQGLKADAAWADVVRIWTNTDKVNTEMSFMHSVSGTLRMQSETDCSTFNLQNDNCDHTAECPRSADASPSDPIGRASGAAAELVWNSLVKIHEMHHNYYNALFQVAAVISMKLDDMENTFAPVPPPEDNTWLLLLIDVLTLGTLAAAGPFFNSALKGMAYFAQKTATVDNLKDTTMTLVGQGTSIAKDLLRDSDHPWTAEKQAMFSNYMGQVVDVWANITSRANEKLFDGSPESLDILYKAMSDGKLIEGYWETPKPDLSNSTNDLRANIAKTFFAYTIPLLWRASGAHVFVIDSGASCDADKPMDAYLSDETMNATGACVDEKRYYLVRPDGRSQECLENGTCEPSKFSPPPGLDRLGDFGGITKEDLIAGAVHTWVHNGKRNGGGFADTSDRGTVEALISVNLTVPGFVRLPVCSPDRAYQSWDTSYSGFSANYPCDLPIGINDCGTASFIDQTSDASPKAEDCLQIIRNIEGDGRTEWIVPVPFQPHRVIASFGSCLFGVEATYIGKNVEFRVGGQDVIDIINDSVKKFGGSGKVGAVGYMDCNGNSQLHGVKWSLY